MKWKKKNYEVDLFQVIQELDSDVGSGYLK